MNIQDVYAPFVRHFRGKRMGVFSAMFCVTPNQKILDVGGHSATWASHQNRENVTLVNLSMESFGGGECRRLGDGRRLPFRDQSFDIAFSNSVIEHLGNWEEQQAFAEEIRRIARYYYVQTPNRWFFVEPHLITPFIHFLPRNWQRHMLRNFSTWGLLLRPTPQQCDDFLAEVRLLTKSEMQRLFPDSPILGENFMGFTKSFIAVRLPPRSDPKRTSGKLEAKAQESA